MTGLRLEALQRSTGLATCPAAGEVARLGFVAGLVEEDFSEDYTDRFDETAYGAGLVRLRTAEFLCGGRAARLSRDDGLALTNARFAATRLGVLIMNNRILPAVLACALALACLVVGAARSAPVRLLRAFPSRHAAGGCHQRTARHRQAGAGAGRKPCKARAAGRGAGICFARTGPRSASPQHHHRA